MADRNYTIVFQTDTTAALAGLGQMQTAVTGLDAAVNGFGQNIAKMGAGVTNAVGSLDQATAAFQANASGAKQAGESISGLGTSILHMAAGFALIQGGTAAMSAFGEAANMARDKIKEMALETMDLRDKMRELANLQNQPGPNNEVTGEAIKLGMQAGMLPPEAVKYLEQFEGSSPAGEQKGNITPAIKAGLMVAGAKFGTRVKLEPKTAGDLAGVMSQYGKIDSVDQGMAQMGRIAMGLNEGRGNLEPLVRSLINTAGAVVGMGGPVESLSDLAAIQGVASTHANPRESGTRVRQAVRALRDLKGPAGGYLESVGIKDGMTHLQRLDKLKDDVKKADASGQGADSFLLSQGFSDQDEIRAVVEQVRDLDIINKRIKKQGAISGQSVMAADDNFLKNERAGIRRKQMATRAGQEFLIGESNERVEMAKENAEQQLRGEGKIGGQGNVMGEWVADLGGLSPFLGNMTAREQKKWNRAEVNLMREAVAKGMDPAKVREMMGYKQVSGGPAAKPGDPLAPIDLPKEVTAGAYGKLFRDTGDERARVQQFNALATEVERLRGRPEGEPPDLRPRFDVMIQEQRETNRILQQRRDNGMPNGQGAFGPPAANPGAGPVGPVKAAAQPKRI